MIRSRGEREGAGVGVGEAESCGTRRRGMVYHGSWSVGGLVSTGHCATGVHTLHASFCIRSLSTDDCRDTTKRVAGRFIVGDQSSQNRGSVPV